MNGIVVLPPAFFAFGIPIAISAVATIVCEERGWRRGVYVFKPLTTGLILALTMILLAAVLLWTRRRREALVIACSLALLWAGLVFSLFGDVFLMLPRDRFVPGLVSFLVAHLLYVAAFRQGGVGFRWMLALPYALYAAVLLRVLLPRVGALKIPVLVYALVLTAMAWIAAERAAAGLPGGSLAAIGAALFVVSDSALALNRFVRPFRGAQPLVLSTYYAAQTLIALSSWLAMRPG
jgi:uncharacterized membrane protein YhhN